MPNPTATELAQIAISSAESARAIANIEPRIAMLSFSTKGSAHHEMVDKVVEATRLAKEQAPDLSSMASSSSMPLSWARLPRSRLPVALWQVRPTS